VEILDFAKPLALELASVTSISFLLHVLNCSMCNLRKTVSVAPGFAADYSSIQADGENYPRRSINLLLNAFDASDQEGRIWLTSRYHPRETRPMWKYPLMMKEWIAKETLSEPFSEPFFTTKSKRYRIRVDQCKRDC